MVTSLLPLPAGADTSFPPAPRTDPWHTRSAGDPTRFLPLERLDALINPPSPPTGGGPGGGGAGGPPQPPRPYLATPNVPRSDLPALARSQVRSIREDARRAATAAPAGLVRAHWQDITDRADEILEPQRGK